MVPDKLFGEEKGFTLIELIIVIAILGMLSTIAVPMVKDVLDNSQGKITAANAFIVQNAIDMYYTENQRYPTSADINDLESELKAFIKNIPQDIKDNFIYDCSKGLLEEKP